MTLVVTLGSRLVVSQGLTLGMKPGPGVIPVLTLEITQMVIPVVIPGLMQGFMLGVAPGVTPGVTPG